MCGQCGLTGVCSYRDFLSSHYFPDYRCVRWLTVGRTRTTGSPARTTGVITLDPLGLGGMVPGLALALVDIGGGGGDLHPGQGRGQDPGDDPGLGGLGLVWPRWRRPSC